MKCIKKTYISIIYIVLGVVLMGCGIAGLLDEFWSGCGGAFIAVGVVQLVRFKRYNCNEEYREKVEIESKDERNQYIAGKAWVYAGRFYVIIAALAVIALRIAGKDEISQVVSGGMCLMLVLYWVFYFLLKRKY